MATGVTPAPASTRASGAFINRNFGALWVGQFVSFIGDALLSATLALWLAFTLGRGQSWAPLAVSGVLLVSGVGTLLLGPISGVFVDRWDKRRTLLGAIAAQALLTAALFAVADLLPLPLYDTGHPTLTMQLIVLYAVIFLVSGIAALARAARTALVGDLVAQPDLPKASGLIETSASLSFLIGFAFAPLVFVPFGIGVALAADVLSFLVAFVAIFTVTAPPSARSVAEGERGSVRGEFFAGLRFSFGNVVVRTLLVSLVVVLVGSGAVNALYIFFLTTDLHTPQEAVGIFPAILGVGLVVGSSLGGVLAGRVGLARIFWVSILLIGIALITLSRQTEYAWALVVAFLLGIPNGLMNVAMTPLILRVTPRELVGRVMTVVEPALTVAQVVSVAIFGTLASTVFSGLRATILGQRFDTYNVLVLLPGVLALIAAVIAFTGLRHPSLKAADLGDSEA